MMSAEMHKGTAWRDLYPSEYARLAPKLTSTARSSLSQVDDMFKSAGMVVPAALCLSASEGDITSLNTVLDDPLIDTVRNVLVFMEQDGAQHAGALALSSWSRSS